MTSNVAPPDLTALIDAAVKKALAQLEWRSPPEVAETLGVDQHTVLTWIKNGELQASNVGRRGATRPRWRIQTADLEAFLASRAATPPPPQARRRRANDFTVWV